MVNINNICLYLFNFLSSNLLNFPVKGEFRLFKLPHIA